MNEQHFSDQLPKHLNEDGDLDPPWERFPNYERHTIGWRMGDGENWLFMWYAFLDTLDPAYDARLAYLRRHPPAPISWANMVHGVLHPPLKWETAHDQAIAQRTELLQLGLIASDAAYPIWLSRQNCVHWPWTLAVGPDNSPEKLARYRTRDFWFWSRQVEELRSNPSWAPAAFPNSWNACAEPLLTGKLPQENLNRGLLSLAQMFAAGRVFAPWQLGLSTQNFADSFEMNMGFVDAFRLWAMTAFDDTEHLQRYLNTTDMPPSWGAWVEEHLNIE